jgi:hypothetical protein
VDSASKLRSVKLAPSPTSTEPVMDSRQPVDPETQRVLTFIRELRRDHVRTHSDPDVLKSQTIESVLAWAKNLKQ